MAWAEPGTLFSACRDGSTPETQLILVQNSVLQIYDLLLMPRLFHHPPHLQVQLVQDSTFKKGSLSTCILIPFNQYPFKQSNTQKIHKNAAIL